MSYFENNAHQEVMKDPQTWMKNNPHLVYELNTRNLDKYVELNRVTIKKFQDILDSDEKKAAE